MNASHSTLDATISAEERLVRQDLAAAYQLISLLKMDDSIYTHISARVPGDHEHFLINPFGLFFNEVTASSLVKIDLEGQIVGQSDYVVNPAGFTIHSAIHAARPDAQCIVHTHTIGGVTVSSLKKGLVPNNQWAFQFYDRVAYHDFEGLALDLDERTRLTQSLGPTLRSLMLRNHGLLTLGRSVAEAFILMHNLERACRVQLAIMSSGGEVSAVSEAIKERTAQQYERGGSNAGQTNPLAREWLGFRRRLEAEVGMAYLD